MNIFFPIHTFYPSQTGGPCNSVYAITKELSLLGHKIYILTTNIGIEKNKVKLNKFYKNKAGITYYDDSLSYLKWLKLMIYLLKRVDAIHITSVFSPFSVFCFLITVIFFPHKKIIISPRGELSEKALIYNQKKKKYVLKMYKFFRKNIYFHATSKKEYNEIKNFFPTAEVITIPNLIKSPERIHHPIQNDFLFVGRIHPIKGIDRLIEACAKSEKFLNSNYRLLIVGKGEKSQLTFYNNLLKIIEENHLHNKVIFLGHQDGKEKEKYYAQSKFLFLTSDSENFGNVVIEALNQGTPVVASLGTPWEILEEFKAGFHIQNSAEEIAKIFDKIIELPEEEYAAYRENAVKLVDQNYNIDSQFYKWIEAYQNVLK